MPLLLELGLPSVSFLSPLAYARSGGAGQDRGGNSPLHLLLIALTSEALQIFLATLLLRLALLFKDLDGLIEGLNSCALHLQLLWERGRISVSAETPDKPLMGGEGRSHL